MAVISSHLLLLGWRILGSMIEQVSEQFMAGSFEYEAALGRRVQVCGSGSG